MKTVLAFAAALAAAWGGGEVLALLFPLARGSFASYMRRRTVRVVGRVAVLALVVAAGVTAGARPAAVVGGAFLGWLLAAGREALREQRARNGSGSG